MISVAHSDSVKHNNDTVIQLFIKDLSLYDNSNIDLLRKFYNLSDHLTRNQLIHTISKIHNRKYYVSNMDPEEEQQLIREQAERMRKFRQQQQQQRQPLLPITTEEELPDSAKLCYNETDPITLDRWSYTNQPTLKIRFIESVTDSIHDPLSRHACYNKESFIKWIHDVDNEAKNWVPEFDTTNSQLASYGDFSLQDTGLYGVPGLDTLIKMPDRQSYFLVNKTLAELSIDYDVTDYTAYKIASNKRVGNPLGTFYESQVHGQFPGYSVYLLLNTQESAVTLLRDFLINMKDTYLLNDFQLHSLETLLLKRKPTILELLTEIQTIYESGLHIEENLQLIERTNILITYLHNQSLIDESEDYDLTSAEWNDPTEYIRVIADYDIITNKFIVYPPIQNTKKISIRIEPIDDPRIVIEEPIELVFGFVDTQPLNELEIINENKEFRVFISFTQIMEKTVNILSLSGIDLDTSDFPILNRQSQWILRYLKLDSCIWNTMSTSIQSSNILVLSIHNSEIYSIPLNAFVDLRYLILETQIDTIPREITTLHSLQYLNIQDNNLSDIPNWFIDYLTTSSHLTLLNIKGNRIDCEYLKTLRNNLTIEC
jgi:hypothetical protein